MNLAFTLGFAGLSAPRKMLTAIEADDYDQAARKLLDSVYARQVGQRAARLAEQLRIDQ